MNVLIVYANPEPSSFCAALKTAAQEALVAAGHGVEVSDLYAEQFNPVAGRHDFSTRADPVRFHYQQEQMKACTENGFSVELQREQARVAKAHFYLFIYPLWWGGMPAILKGWFDRVMAYGFAYADGKRFDTGFFKGRHGLLAITTGGTPERFSEDGVYGPIETLLTPQRRTMLEYLGLTVAPPFVAYGAARVSQQMREQYLLSWKEHVVDAADDANKHAEALGDSIPNFAKSKTSWSTST